MGFKTSVLEYILFTSFLLNFFTLKLVMSANYIEKSNTCLNEAVFRRIQPYGLRMCRKVCDAAPACLSFTYQHNISTCLLSWSSGQTYDLVVDENCTYFEKLGNASTCGDAVCSTGDVCVNLRNRDSKCITQRCTDPLVVDNIQRTTAHLPVGTLANLTCISSTMKPEYNCNSGGNWEQKDYQCNVGLRTNMNGRCEHFSKCNSEVVNWCQGCDPLTVENLEYTPFKPIHTKINITCSIAGNVGYQTYFCNENKSWVMTIDACTGACDALTVNNIQYTTTAKPVNTTINVSCVSTTGGYTTIGYRTYLCSENSLWVISVDTCFAFKIFQSYATSTYSKGQSDCAAEGARLAIVDTDAKYNALSTAVVNHVSDTNSPYYFIGMSDLDSEGTFKWIDGRNVVYSGWDPGQPDNFRGIQDCGIFEKVSAKWHDFDCNTNSNFICEKIIS